MILYENTIRNFRDAISSRKMGSFLEQVYFEKMRHDLEPMRFIRWKYALESIRFLLSGSNISSDCGLRIDTMFNGGQEQLMIILASLQEDGLHAALLTLFSCQSVLLSDMEDIVTFTDESGIPFVCVHPAYQAQSTLRYYLKKHDGTHSSAHVCSLAYLYDCPFNGRTDIRSGYTQDILKEAPIFYAGEEGALLKQIRYVLNGHQGIQALNRFYRIGQAPNTESSSEGNEKKAFLSDHKMIFTEITKTISLGKQCFYLIEGQSGTGKTLLADSLRSELKQAGIRVTNAIELPEIDQKERLNLLLIDGKSKFQEEMADRADVLVCFYDSRKLTDIKLLTALRDAAYSRNVPLRSFTLSQNMSFADNGKGLNWLLRHFQLANVPKREWDPSAYSIETVKSANLLPKSTKEIASVLVRKEIYLDSDGKTIKGSATAKAKVYELFSMGAKGVVFFCEDGALQTKISRDLQASKSKFDWLRQYDISADLNGEKLAEAQTEILQNRLVRVKFEKQARSYLGEDTWEKLSESSKMCLVSALLAYHDMKEYNQLLDFSGVCIQVCKAVETELFERFFQQYTTWIMNKYKNFALEKAPKYMVLFENEHRRGFKTKESFNLGSVSAITGLDDKGEIRNKAAWLEFSDYAKKELLKNGDDPRNTLSEQLPIISKIRIDYRNRAAHKGNIDIVTAKDCLDYVVTVYRKLGVLLDAYQN